MITHITTIEVRAPRVTGTVLTGGGRPIVQGVGIREISTINLGIGNTIIQNPHQLQTIMEPPVCFSVQ
jgi:hypothetical protein